jgi:hypothetical protein
MEGQSGRRFSPNSRKSRQSLNQLINGFGMESHRQKTSVQNADCKVNKASCSEKSLPTAAFALSSCLLF